MEKVEKFYYFSVVKMMDFGDIYYILREISMIR